MIHLNRVVVLALATLTLTACNKTAPITGPTAVFRIDSVTPTVLQPSPQPQTVTITGAGFTGNLDVVVTGPNAASQTDVVRIVSPTQASVDVTLASPGTYTLRLDDARGNVSSPVSLTVESTASQAAVLTSVSPGVTTLSAQPQTVTLSGLRLTTAQQLQLSRPDGQIVILLPGQFTVLDDTTLTFAAVLDKKGLYSVVVTNTVGASNSVTITAN